MAAEEFGPDINHYVVEVNIKQVTHPRPDGGARPGTGQVPGKAERRVAVLSRVVTTSADLEAAVDKATRMLSIELGEDA
jgi:hypothetical protein